MDLDEDFARPASRWKGDSVAERAAEGVEGAGRGCHVSLLVYCQVLHGCWEGGTEGGWYSRCWL